MVYANSSLGNDDNVRWEDEIMLMQPEKLPKQPLHAVTAHRIADFLAHRKSKTPGQRIVFPCADKENKTL